MGTVAGPTQTGLERDGQSESWIGRPGLALLVRGAILGAPLCAAFATTLALASLAPADRIGVNRWVWLAGVITVSTLVLRGVDRIVSRFAPLATLLKLSLAFPAEAPRRYRIALRSFSTRSVQRRLDDIRRTGRAIDERDFRSAQMLELITLLGEHDRMTRGHSERVRAYAALIGEELELSAEQMEKLNWAALLHDLGKLRVPPEILNKDGRPSEEEWRILQGHPMAGLPLSEPLAGWLGEWRGAMSAHHERWDGGGYPKGLAGDAIPFAGRIVAIADAYDVMTSTRSYKAPYPAAVARAEIADHAARQFDPHIARAFLAVPVGKLRRIAGPLSWLGSLPGLRAVSAADATSHAVMSVAGSAVAALTAVVAAVAIDSPPTSAATDTDPRIELAIDVAPTAPGVSDDLDGGPLEGSTDADVPAGLPAAIGEESNAERVVAIDDLIAVTEGGTARFDVLANDLNAAGATGLSVRIAEPPTEGVAEVESDGVISYAHDGGDAPYDSFTYVVIDAEGRETIGGVRLSIEGVNDPPVAAADVGSVARGSIVTLDVVANDVDPDATSLHIVAVSGAAHGEAFANEDGTVSYLHGGDEATTDTFSYTVADPEGATSDALVTISIFVPNDPPVAVDDVALVTEGGDSFVEVLDNDSDPDPGDVLALVSASGATNGSVSVNEDGQVVYEHDGSETTSDEVTYVIEDEQGERASAVVRYTVQPQNDPPVAAADALAVGEGSAGVVAVLANDVDPDAGASLTVLSVSSPTNGSVSLAADFSVTYTHDGSETTSDSFTYVVVDEVGATSIGTVGVTVTSVNDLPVAVADASTVAAGNVAWIDPVDLVSNDFDAEDGVGFGAVTVTLDPTPPVRGTATQVGGAGGLIQYTPGAGTAATETLGYSVCDSGGACVAGSIVVTITGGSTVLISEYSGGSSYSGGDFVELYNAGTGPVDVSGWELHLTDEASASILTIPAATVLPAGGFYLFATDGPLTATRDQAIGFPLGESLGVGLAQLGTYIDVVGNRARLAGTPVPAALIQEGVGVAPLSPIGGFDLSYTRALPDSIGACSDTDDNAADFIRTWGTDVTPTGSAGAPVTCGPQTSSTFVSGVVIKELRTDGEAGDSDEYVVLFNPTIGTQDLTGMTLRRDGAVITTLPAVTLAPGQHFLVAGAQYGGASDALYDPGEHLFITNVVQLRDASGFVVVDEVILDLNPPGLPHLGQGLPDVYARRASGCQDNDASSDFSFSGVPAPRTFGDPLRPCP